MLAAGSLFLLTDLYQLTMASAYRRAGVDERRACFHLFFRKNPYAGGYTVACGLEDALDWIAHARPSAEDLEYLAALKSASGRPLFEPGFLDWLAKFEPDFDVDAVPEGTVVFPHEPMLRVIGPIATAQIQESALCNIVNFQSLIATKAARVCSAAQGDPVIEFGMRRAQGPDGAISASRAAYVGGCESTSHVLAGRLYGIPVRGTHAHSFAMLWEDEAEAFRAWGRAFPDSLTFLVDTYDTLRGTRIAIEVGRELKAAGHELAGIRLDSGDLAYLSIESRRILDEAGFPNAKVLASGDLDEHVIASLKAQGARIDSWGVGTRLSSGQGDAALGGVYKLAAVQDGGGHWRHRMKRSDQASKSTVPGILQVTRFTTRDGFCADAIHDLLLPVPDRWTVVDPADPTRRKDVPEDTTREELLVPVIRGGKRVSGVPPIAAVRERAIAQLAKLHPGVKRLLNAHSYPAGLEESLHELRMRMILAAHERPPLGPTHEPMEKRT